MQNVMGLKTSPCASIQGALWAKRLIKSDFQDRQKGDNPFAWEVVQRNYPGSNNCDPSLAWLAKIDWEDWVATELHQCVDDLWLMAET